MGQASKLDIQIEGKIIMEKWIKWEPLEEIKGKFYIDAICDDINGLRFALSNEKAKIEVIFNGFVASYRSIEEGYKQKAIYEMQGDYDSSYFRNASFFIIKNSEYIAWLCEESYDIYTRNLIHFVICEYNSFVDIITTEEPTIKILPQENEPQTGTERKL